MKLLFSTFSTPKLFSILKLLPRLKLLLRLKLLPTKTAFIAPIVLLLCAPNAFAIDGDTDDSFNASANNFITAIEVQRDGKILVGGAFTQINNANNHQRIARLTADGQLDPDFIPVTVNDIVRSIVVQNSGQIVLGGDFTMVNGNTVRNHLVRLNPDGSLDPSFNPNVTRSGGTPAVSVLVLQTIDGIERILVGGSFTAINNIPRSSIARLNSNGSTDTDYVSNFGGVVSAIALDANNRAFIAGRFNDSNQELNSIARLNADGSTDDNFNSPNLRFSFGPGLVRALAVQNDGRLIAVGLFNLDDGEQVGDDFVRLNTDGSLDSSFNVQGFSERNSTVNEMVIQPNGQILVAGLFTDLTTEAEISNIARLNPDGDVEDDFIPDVLEEVLAMTLQPSDGNILIGGAFGRVNGEIHDFIARLENNAGNFVAPEAEFNFISSPVTTLLEGDDTTTVFNFTVSRTRNINGTSSVDYSLLSDLSDDTSINDFVDGTLVQGRLTFTDGQFSQTISLVVNGDTQVEADEEFVLTLSEPVNGVIGAVNQVTGIIQNDDEEQVIPVNDELCLPINIRNGKIAVVCL